MKKERVLSLLLVVIMLMCMILPVHADTHTVESVTAQLEEIDTLQQIQDNRSKYTTSGHYDLTTTNQTVIDRHLAKRNEYETYVANMMAARLAAQQAYDSLSEEEKAQIDPALAAKLFTNLDQLREGDRFMIYVLDEMFTYEVDQIRIVLPDDVTDLKIEKGEDLCTLVTCTPYAVNSHRLLVRGHRVENDTISGARVISDAIQLDDTMVALVISVPILLGLFIWLLVYYRKR